MRPWANCSFEFDFEASQNGAEVAMADVFSGAGQFPV